MKEQRTCELCDQEASIYCPSDSAFLCSTCDTTVHQANFLVARHLRYSLSSSSSSKRHRFTNSHIPSSPSSSSLSSESYATSSKKNNKTTSSKTTIITTRTKNTTTSSSSNISLSSVITNGAAASSSPSVITNGTSCSLFVKWSRELELGGVNGNFASSLASRALGFCLGKWRGLPFRVAAATSFWFGLRFCGLQKNQNLITRLEVISGVPAKLIIAAHAKLARVFTLRRREYYYSHSNLPRQEEAEEEEEGWDEC